MNNTRTCSQQELHNGIALLDDLIKDGEANLRQPNTTVFQPDATRGRINGFKMRRSALKEEKERVSLFAI
jgi:hypothetical protein